MTWYSFPSYVPVAERKAKAAKEIARQTKKEKQLSPIVIEGRQIAKTFWGKAWCDNLESYSDFENRLPRGRTYVRNGSVFDLQITRGEIHAQIMGSSLYQGKISITPLSSQHWEKIKKQCVGKIESVVELLQGTFSQSVMEIMTRRDTGLFPKPSEIHIECSCPDWASLCKHLAAVLYGIGARLDTRPELLFLLRGVDPTELIAQASTAPVLIAGQKPTALDSNLSEIFGIELTKPAAAATPISKKGSPLPKLPGKKVTLYIGKRNKKTGKIEVTKLKPSTSAQRKTSVKKRWQPHPKRK